MRITKTMFDMIMFDMNNVWRMNQYYSVSRPACGAGPIELCSNKSNSCGEWFTMALKPLYRIYVILKTQPILLAGVLEVKINHTTVFRF